MSNPVIRRIDKSSQIPYYYQLGEILKEEIELGRWAPGELIFSEASLADLFAVSRTVIRKALDMLEADGAVVRIKGKGTVVAQPKFRYEAVAAAGEWSRNAWNSESRLGRVVDIRDVPAGAHVGRVLRTPPDEQVFELTVVQLVGDRPASFSQIYLRKDATPALSALAGKAHGAISLIEGGPDVLVQLATRYGLQLSESLVTVEVSLATEFEAGLIGIPRDAPIFLLSSVDVDTSGAPVSFTRAIVRADHFRFSVGIHYHTASVPGPDAQGVMSLVGPKGRTPAG